MIQSCFGVCCLRIQRIIPGIFNGYHRVDIFLCVKCIAVSVVKATALCLLYTCETKF